MLKIIQKIAIKYNETIINKKPKEERELVLD